MFQFHWPGINSYHRKYSLATLENNNLHLLIFQVIKLGVLRLKKVLKCLYLMFIFKHTLIFIKTVNFSVAS